MKPTPAPPTRPVPTSPTCTSTRNLLRSPLNRRNSRKIQSRSRALPDDDGSGSSDDGAETRRDASERSLDGDEQMDDDDDDDEEEEREGRRDEKKDDEQDMSFPIALQVYPFPPTTYAPSHPIDQTPPWTLRARDAASFRKRLLTRWQEDVDDRTRVERASANGHGDGGDARAASASASASASALKTRPGGERARRVRKRARSPTTALAAPAYNLVEGDPVLPLRARAHAGMVASGARRGARAGKTRRGETSRCVDGRGEREDGLEALQQVRQRIGVLRERRTRLEEEAMEQISRAGNAMGTDVTEEEKQMLKVDMEKLSQYAVREVLRVVSRRVKDLQVVAEMELKLQLDLLPTELIRELQVVVQRERGLAHVDNVRRLMDVRTELKVLMGELRNRVESRSRVERKA